MNIDKANVIIPTNIDNPPEQHELEAAWILAKHFNCDVEFIKPVVGYKVKTADFVIKGQPWEMKSPKGNSKQNTIKKQFRNARGKSKFLIIDGRRTLLDDAFIMGKIRFELKNHRSISKLLFITKEKIVLEIK